MAFMRSSSGEFTTYVKYNAKEGRWFTKEDKPDSVEFEVKNMTAVFDMENIQTGWFIYPPGGAPIKVFDPSMHEEAPKPGDGYKRGFQLHLFSEKNLLGVREFGATAGVVINAMNSLHTDWEANAAANPGKLPIVKCAGVVAITSKHGKNYEPQLEIVGWADRPAELDGPAAPKAEPKQEARREPEPATVGAGDDDVEY